jgi:hypothetical protein
VALDERSVDGVGERKLGEVLGDVLLHLVLLEAGGLAEMTAVVWASYERAEM